MSALSVRGVVAGYGATEVLHGLDLEVPAGSLTAILGPSGSGKTTLLRVIAGFERPTAGAISVAEVMVDGAGRHLPPERRRVGYVAQDGALFPHLTVARNVAFGLRRGASRAARVTELLELVGLGALARRYPHELSGGQQQRVALARALATDPPVILLDEPFAALDAALRADVRSEIAAILRTSKTTAVLVTHDQDEALSMADQVAVLRAGRIVQAGPPDELYRRPVDAELARFLGAANVIPAVIGDGGAACLFGVLSCRAGSGPAEVLIRPEQLRIAGDGVDATVTAVDYHGHDVMVSLLAPDGRSLVMRTLPSLETVVGAALRVSVVGPVHFWQARAA